MSWKNTDLSQSIYEIIESHNAYARFPYRYFVFGSLSSDDDSPIRAKAIQLDKRDDEQWAIELRRYYVKVAKQSHCELVHVSVGDCATHFHSLVMASAPIKAKVLMEAWPYCDGRTIKSGSRKGERRKEVRTYLPELNGLAYMYDHHTPFQAEHITSRRVWRGWKEDAAVSAINSCLKVAGTYGRSNKHL